MPQRALITGVSGFAGGHLAEHLLACGDAVLGTSPDGRWEAASPGGLRGRVELVAWDFTQPGGLAPEPARVVARFAPTHVYHLAAMSVPETCGKAEPTPQAWAVNVEGTRRVLELAASLPVRPRVLLISSSHVYRPVLPEKPYVSETAALGPINAYGRTKLAAEELAAAAVARGDCEAIVVRAFHHTGPRQSPQMMLPQWARQFADGTREPVAVYTRDSHLDLSDVRDVVRAYRLLVELGTSGEVYNVGSGVNRSSGQVLNILRALADPQRTIIELRPGFRQEAIADVTRLVRSTGWQPAIRIEQTVADTLAWWREQGLGTGG